MTNVEYRAEERVGRNWAEADVDHGVRPFVLLHNNVQRIKSDGECQLLSQTW